MMYGNFGSNRIIAILAGILKKRKRRLKKLFATALFFSHPFAALTGPRVDAAA